MDVEIFLRSQQRTEGETLCQEQRLAGALEWEGEEPRLRWREEGPAGAVEAELRFSGGEAVLRRQGAVRARMVFAVGRRCPADYETPWGTLPLETETEYLGRSLSGSGGGRVLLRYVLRSGGAILGHYSLKMNIRERNKEHDQHD